MHSVEMSMIFGECWHNSCAHCFYWS